MQAACALGQLVFKESSTEAAVRWVLRIATQRGHTWWQAWSYLQLSDTHPDVAEREIQTVVRLLDEVFPGPSDQRDQIIDSVITDLHETRRLDDSKYYSASVTELERSLSILMRRSPEKLTTSDRNEIAEFGTYLDRVRNKAQTYLMGIETGTRVSHA